MNVSTPLQPSQKYSQSASATELVGTTLAAESGSRKVSQYSQQENYLRKDIELFNEVAGHRIPDKNIMVSPKLVSATESLKDSLTIKDTGLNEQTIFPETQRPAIGSTSPGIGMHVLSKRSYVDEKLATLKIPHTTSQELEQKGYAVASRELNERISKDSQNMITDMLSPDALKNPNLAFKLVTWLFQHASWKEPFEVMNKSSGSEIKWNDKNEPKINWMTSGADINHIAYSDIDGFEFIALPVKESGLQTLFVMPPSKQEKVAEDQIVNILSEGISSMLGKKFAKKVILFLPKFNFNYTFEKNYPAAHAIHRAALNINEEGADVGAASDLEQEDGIRYDPELYINRPFYFAMINQQNKDEPRMVGMAYVNQPWED